MMKRICKFKYKLIMLLLILSILLGEFAVRPMSVKAIDLATYTYWDLWYSIAGAQHASMSAKEGPFDGYDAAELKDRAKVQFDNFKTWLQRAYVPVGITVDMLVNQADEMIANAKTTGLEMSQELWDAFRQYFDDVANDKEIILNQSVPMNRNDIQSYLRNICSCDEINLSNISDSTLNNFMNKKVAVVKDFNSYWNGYILVTPETSVDGYFSFVKGWYGNAGALIWHGVNGKDYDNMKTLVFREDYSFTGDGIVYSSVGRGDDLVGFSVLAYNWSIPKLISKEYSPFIDYTVSQGCPAEVPETIPWRVYPKEETDDDTKIIPFPVEVPDEGTTEVPGEETTEKPNPDEDPDNDNDEENDPFPGIFPWFPSAPEIPEYKPWVPDDDDDPDPDPDPEPDPPPPPSDEDDPEPEPDPDPDPPPPPGKVEGYLNKLKTKFPFCIPFDMVTLFKKLNKTQKAPKWTFSYTFHFGNKPYTWTIVVDMADYDKYIQIFREGFFVLFLVGLFFVTRKLISWQID